MVRNKLQQTDRIKKNIPLFIMAAPALIFLIMFNYVPMYGIILAFKDYSYRDGIWGSDWVGIENFKYVFGSGEITRTIGNTVLYHIAFTAVITLGAILLATMLFFIKSKHAANFYQQATILPFMISYAVISHIVYIFLKNDGGLVNSMLTSLGTKTVSWYMEPKFWPFILVFVNAWFGIGIKAVYYFSAYLAVDESQFEAADLDGASRWRKIINIMLPSISSTVCIFLILDLGNILASDFSLFYSVPRDSSALYSVTDVLGTYTYRGLTSGDISTTTALGLFTGVVTTIMTLLVNFIVKKISPENSLL